MSIRITGLDSVIRTLERTPAEIIDGVRLAMDSAGFQMVRDAKALRTRPKKSLGDATNRSIEKKVDGLVLTFRINPAGVTTSKGFNYAWAQNDGTHSRYKQGEISPACNNIGGTKLGLPHQDFMGEAWKKNLPILTTKIKKICGESWRS